MIVGADPVRIGVDVGGTKIAFGIVDDKHRIISDIPRFEVKPFKSGEALVDKLVDEIKKLLDDQNLSTSDLRGIGIGTPGPLDLSTGTVLETPNMPMLHNFGLKDAVQNKSGVETRVNNDANCFVLGEALAGEAQHGKYVVGVTLGTGYGCAIVLDKKIYEGATGTAAEIAYCPHEESYLEEYISGRGLAKMYKSYSGKDLKGPEIAKRAEQGEEAALQTFQEFGMHLGKSFSWYVNLLDPDYIVVGGSISKDWDYFAGSMQETMNKYINTRPMEHLQVVQSKLGESAAIIGAAGLITV